MHAWFLLCLQCFSKLNFQSQYPFYCISTTWTFIEERVYVSQFFIYLSKSNQKNKNLAEAHKQNFRVKRCNLPCLIPLALSANLKIWGQNCDHPVRVNSHFSSSPTARMNSKNKELNFNRSFPLKKGKKMKPQAVRWWKDKSCDTPTHARQMEL